MNPEIWQAAANLRYVRRYCIRLAMIENHYRKTNHPRTVHATRLLDWWMHEQRMCADDLSSLVLDAYGQMRALLRDGIHPDGKGMIGTTGPVDFGFGTGLGFGDDTGFAAEADRLFTDEIMRETKGQK